MVGIEEPPQTVLAALRRIGPGIVLAGTIVGSGELILTTSFGAKYGFVFLWLILLSCFIKVFVQIEIGRFAISSGMPTLRALAQIKRPIGSLLVWWWFGMMACTVFQLGGMVGTIGQSMHLAFPEVSHGFARWVSGPFPTWTGFWNNHQEYVWAGVTCLVTIALIYRGGYRRIEWLTTVIVVSVTLLTGVATLSLRQTEFAFSLSDLASGLTMQVPSSGLADAFAIFGITGVGATELFYYPYWCLEKGYARFVGPRDDSDAWKQRALGWIRVLYLDAWVSCLVYTVSTSAFYVMGAAVLHARGLNPEKSEMVATLSRMFGEPFGDWARTLFLIGAAVVLFKTLYLACAANSRLTVDFCQWNRWLSPSSPEQHQRWVAIFCLLFPLAALFFYLFARDPQWMVKVGGLAQAATLPMIGAATLYFRHRLLDPRLRPSWLTDALHWLAVGTLFAAAVYALPAQVWDLGKWLGGGAK